MTERDLSSLLLDHLNDEPPVAITSGEAVRSGRRQGRVRLALGAGASVVLVGAGTVGVVALGGDDGGPHRAKDVPAATQSAAPAPQSTLTPVQDRIDAVAQEQLAPLVGQLGDPTWDAAGAAGKPADQLPPQYVQVTYHLAGAAELHLKVGGFAEGDSTFYLAPVCPSYEAEGVTSECQDETLDDGTLVTTLVGPHTRVTNTSSRLPTVQWALRHPDGVLWARTVSVATPDGVTTTVSEYVEATAPENARWLLPTAVLRTAATDAELLDPAAVAHEPMD